MNIEEQKEVTEITEVESNKPYMVQYEEELKAYRDGVIAIQMKYALALERFHKKELSKSQLKKIDAQTYNELREYKKVTPRPVDRRKSNHMSPTLAAMMSLANIGKLGF